MSSRALGLNGVAVALSLLLGLTCGDAAEVPRGGTLRFLVEQEPTTLVTIAHTAGPSTRISPKVTEGLLTYGFGFKPQPALATEWEVTPDGLRYSFKLRPNVKWHDGRDFTSADVAYSVKLLKENHPRGRGTFAFVQEVQTPDPLTAIIILSKPAPYLLKALDASESPIVPKHVYEGTDPLANKNASAPIGTGPFVFKEWVKGSHIILDRNPNYWDPGKPYLDRIIVRFIADQAARSVAFETGELDLGGGPPVPRSDLARLQVLPHLGSETRGYEYNAGMTQLYFNYDNPILRDKRVRLAIAHAIDYGRLLDFVYFGYGKVAPSAVSPELAEFVDPSIKPYALDLAKANRLLDEAGYPKKADGTRFPIRLYANPFNLQAAGDFVKQALTKLGIAVDFQFFDFSTYINKTYTGREFDITLESLSNTFDPTPGIQRAFWSKNFKIGLPFSNASHYANPVVDQLLEDAAVEPDAEKRRALWFKFQNLIYDDVAAIHLVAPDGVTLFNKTIRNHTLGVTGINASFADIYFDK
ncbi:MAG: ABC transporter substrate-binding protein [Bradyrhizobium sp.]|uniref:ABC transporter substrate-binding protein n=3 Tax=Bradyrhizobium TaxID=374 RepID=A0ABS5FZU4_9BRAD|nr:MULTISPECIES: ABC transporter substrate-binding protein [Bradyrhizobium]ABQ36855.1 putative ABC transporter (substrate-binding protein) [Bradyrhizobium sp. BTAi1]MBR1134547.1 ABC transporter substrate-binding protein [Bradyrhizobium denitrificans]MDU1491965.1 ABC transporter substrate-binding protein [Bradyrhizobium sp.]MDU1541990.1 ABC transporter substrate-binding protein [Bradyrhizobium sp.]MDU1803023.1 ABC transporter substrate-binding protein [Bradyrhizobium sp.]